MADPNYQPQSPPAYQQPLQGQHSNEYASYPQFNQEQQQQQNGQRWGTPANPSAHPDNQYAASGGYSPQQQSQTSTTSPGGSLRRQSSSSFQDQANASKTQAPPSVPGQAQQSPYVQQTGPTTSSYKGTMDQFMSQLTEYGKKAQVMGQNVWSHLTTGPSVGDTAWGRLSAGTQLVTKGGFEGVFKTTFPADADEVLKKTYACFLSTSTGPVAGTLFISSKKLAFCSDRPLTYTPSPGQQAYSFYKVIIPVDKIRDVSPSVNQNKPAEKYIQVTTQDNFEFWFMGFVNYDKGLKNLQATVAGRGPTQSAGPAQQQPYPPSQAYPPNRPGNYPEAYPPNQYGVNSQASPHHS